MNLMPFVEEYHHAMEKVFEPLGLMNAYIDSIALEGEESPVTYFIYGHNEIRCCDLRTGEFISRD